MIPVTDQMIYAFAGEPEITATDAHAIRVGLAAVLAIVERDQAGRCSATLPRLAEYGDLWCQLRHGHLGDHEMGPTRWKEIAKPTCTCCGSGWPHVPSSERCTPLVEPTVKLKGICRRCGSPLAACLTCGKPSQCGDGFCAEHAPDPVPADQDGVS